MRRVGAGLDVRIDEHAGGDADAAANAVQADSDDEGDEDDDDTEATRDSAAAAATPGGDGDTTTAASGVELREGEIADRYFSIFRTAVRHRIAAGEGLTPDLRLALALGGLAERFMVVLQSARRRS